MSPDEHTQTDQTQDDQASVEELTALCKRIQAEFDNYRKRTQAQEQEIRHQAQAQIIAKLLPTLDAMELALQHANSDDVQTLQQVVKGMQFIQQQLVQTLQDAGVNSMDTNNKPYDAYKHEAIHVIPANEQHPDNTIVETRQKGYEYNGKIIRGAKVVVARQQDNQHSEQEQTNEQQNQPQQTGEKHE